MSRAWESNLFGLFLLVSAVVICLVLLTAWGDPEPALPRCPADRVAHGECRP